MTTSSQSPQSPTAPPDGKTSRVLILDDHPLMRIGLRTLITIDGEFEICGEIDRARGAIDKILALDPDVLLLDLSLPDGSGYALIKDLRASGFRTPILVISMHPEAGFAERALKAGANGYLMKQTAPEAVIDALRQVLRGEIYVSPEFARKMLQSFSSPKGGGMAMGVDQLTDREFEIFQLISQGQPTRQIAKELCISPKTVEAHRTNMRAKLDLKSGAELVRFAIQWFEDKNA